MPEKKIRNQKNQQSKTAEVIMKETGTTNSSREGKLAVGYSIMMTSVHVSHFDVEGNRR